MAARITSTIEDKSEISVISLAKIIHERTLGYLIKKIFFII